MSFALRSSRRDEGKPLIPTQERSISSSSSSWGYITAIVILSVIAIAGIALTITFGVLWGDARFPKTFSAATVPENVNNFYKDVFERTYCGSNSIPATPSFGVVAGWEPCYSKINTTTKLFFLDLEHPVDTLFSKELPLTHKNLLGSGQMTNAQENAIKNHFDVESNQDIWTLKDTTPAICQTYYRGTNYAQMALNAGWFVDAEPTTFRFIFTPYFRTNYQTLIPMYNSTTVQIYLQEFESLKNMMIQARTGQFYERQDAWLLANLGVNYAVQYADEEFQDTIDGLTYLWNSADFSSGSSLLYDNIIFKGAEAGFFLSMAEDSAIRQGITDVETEMINFINYQFDAFSAMTLYDNYAPINYPSGRPVLSLSQRYAFGMSHNVTGICSGKPMHEGMRFRNALDEFNRFNQEWIVQHQTADAILNVTLPDYLGWNLVWIHLYFGTEAGVTDLGFYAPTDCPNGDITDPAYAFTMNAQNEGNGAYEFEMGGAHQTQQPMQLYFGNYYGGCDDVPGDAYVQSSYGDFKNRGGVIQTIGPLQPKDSVWNVALHEHTHTKQLSSAIFSCPACYFYQLATFFATGSETSSMLEGGAVYAERNSSLLDTHINVIGSGTLREAALALEQIAFRVDRFRPTIAIMSSAETVTQAATDYFTNSPIASLYFGTLTDIENFFETQANTILPLTGGWNYPSGAHRYEQMRKKVQTQCPNVPQAVLKVYDSETALPAMPLSALEVAIDDYVAGGCKKWPYEETNIF